MCGFAPQCLETEWYLEAWDAWKMKLFVGQMLGRAGERASLGALRVRPANRRPHAHWRKLWDGYYSNNKSALVEPQNQCGSSSTKIEPSTRVSSRAISYVSSLLSTDLATQTLKLAYSRH